MSRFASLSLLAVLAIAVALAPNVAAKDSLSLALPTEPLLIPANQSNATMTVKVTLNVDMGHCPAGTSADMKVDLKAELKGASVAKPASLNVTVEPASLLFSVPAGATATSAKTYTGDAKVSIVGTGITVPVAATVTITATTTGAECVVPSQGLAISEPATGSTAVQFLRPTSNNTAESTEQPVPGLEMPAVAIAVIALAILLRRRN